MLRNRLSLSRELYATHPALTRIFYEFKSKYVKFRLIDLDAIVNTMPITIDEFTQLVETQVKARKQHLFDNWLRECSNAVADYRDSIEAMVASTNEVKCSKMFV